MGIKDDSSSLASQISAYHVVRIAVALILGGACAFLFKAQVYDTSLAMRKFADYGPSLFTGGQPDELLYLYVVLVATSTVVGWLLARWVPAMGAATARWRYLAMFLVMFLVAVSAIGIGAIGHDLSTPHIQQIWRVLAIAGAVGYVASLPVMGSTLSLLPTLAGRVFAFLFTAITLFHLPKLYVLHDMFLQSGMKYPTAGLFLGLSALAAAMGMLLARGRRLGEQLLLALVLAMIYLVSIRESWVYWGLDAFHEGESFLAVPFMFDAGSGFFKDFFPMHGLGRNILHSYYAALFSDTNLYFSRIVQALTYPFVHVLVAACLYRYARTLLVPVAFFVLTYFFGLLEERDVSPFLLIALLLVQLDRDTGRTGLALKLGTGLTLFLAAIYSIEYFLFVNVAMAVTLAHWTVSTLWNRQAGNIPWMHVAFYAGMIIFFALLGSESQIWMGAILSSLQKSPNLLQRPLIAPVGFSMSFLLIGAFFALFMMFFVAQVVAFLSAASHRSTSFDMLIAIVAMLSLMFFVRAFNRSDVGHVLYAFAISLPVILAVSMHHRWIGVRVFAFLSLSLLALFTMHGLANKSLSMDALRQRPLYDNRLKQADVRPAKEFGAITVPAGVIDDSHMTKDELVTLRTLVGNGYKLLDMTNQPVLIYGAVGSPLVANDMHTLFYNTYGEQQDVIRRLQTADKTLVVWSAGHWSETLDGTYAEYRLPILSSYIIKAFPKAYKIGRFVVLSKENLSLIDKMSPLALVKYDLGYAPSRMAPYKQEREVPLHGNGERNITNGTAPDAIAVVVDAMGGGDVVARVRSSGRVVCEITFKAPAGVSRNFIRLSNLPCYVRQDSVEIDVVAGDAGSKVKAIDYIFLNFD